jgi:dTDP-glucose pyrophosphorylase
MNERYRKIIVKLGTPIKEALKQMNESAMQVLIVVNSENKIVGIVTDGDIRRGIIKNISFEEPIENIMNKNPITLKFPAKESEAIELMRKYSIRHIPIVNENNEVVDLILWSDFLNNGKVTYHPKDTNIVIMAGGRGTRLDPFTKILPKPLIPIGEKTIIERVMDNFKRYGFNKFIITLKYKAEMIKTYLSENSKDYQIEFVEEGEYLGTAGGLALLKDKLINTFILSNCDIIIDADFDSVLNYHRENNNKVTILGVLWYVKIPYGVLKIKGNNLEKFVEKPEYNIIINSGIYILEPDIINLIPEGKYMDMPELLKLAQINNFKIQVYPMNCTWFDVGQWEEYNKAVDFIKKYGGL